MKRTCFFACGRLQLGWVELWQMREGIRRMFEAIEEHARKRPRTPTPEDLPF